MKRIFKAKVWQEGNWHIAQAVEVEVTSQGESHEQALNNLREALELYFEPSCATSESRIHDVEVEVAAG